jgi:hypothetical protein
MVGECDELVDRDFPGIRVVRMNACGSEQTGVRLSERADAWEVVQGDADAERVPDPGRGHLPEDLGYAIAELIEIEVAMGVDQHQ